MALLLTILAVLSLLLLNEFWWRHHRVHGELSRKFVHISVGSFVAFWPFWLSWAEIQLLSVAFVLAVGISKYVGLFQAIHSVQRPTWGEICFGAAVGLVTLLTEDRAVYAAALLQMSLADGLAAVIGHHYGKRTSYKVLGHTKSMVGTLTFFVVSFGLLLAAQSHLSISFHVTELAVLGAAASLIENLGIRGLDNLLVPLLVALVLGHV